MKSQLLAATAVVLFAFAPAAGAQGAKPTPAQAKAFVAFRLAQFSGGLTGVAAAGGQAAGALKLLGAASLPAKLGLTGVSLAAIQLSMELLTIARNYGAYRAELAKHPAMQAQVAQKRGEL